MHSYLYYVLDESIIEDATFDFIAQSLFANWPAVSHPHRDLIERAGLTAGSGYYLRYPASSVHAALGLLRHFRPDIKSAFAPPEDLLLRQYTIEGWARAPTLSH